MLDDFIQLSIGRMKIMHGCSVEWCWLYWLAQIRVWRVAKTSSTSTTNTAPNTDQ